MIIIVISLENTGGERWSPGKFWRLFSLYQCASEWSCRGDTGATDGGWGRTNLLPVEITDLYTCLRSTCFTYKREKQVYYEQREGAAMGSPVSPIVANLYYGVFWGRCPTYSSKQAKAVEEVCGWHLLHCQERRGGPAPAAPKWYLPLDQVHSRGGGRGETPFPWDLYLFVSHHLKYTVTVWTSQI